MEEIFKKYDEKIQEILLKDPDYLKSQADKKLLEDAKIVYSKMNDEELKKSYEELQKWKDFPYDFDHRKLYESHPLTIERKKYQKELDSKKINFFIFIFN
jgi:vacuolar-type H+-ATPase subunit E/Vma4